MLYYRTHASRAGELPPELVGWASPNADLSLSENVVGDHRVVAITPPMVFAPPEAGWTKLCAGWEVANTGAFSLMAHAKITTKWLCKPTTFDGEPWLLPVVLNAEGTRAFKVSYGGTDFTPQLTADQVWALALATEIRTCHDGGTMPEVSQRAKWAAQLLGLTYCLSTASIGHLSILTDETIDAVLASAGGYLASVN